MPSRRRTLLLAGAMALCGLAVPAAGAAEAATRIEGVSFEHRVQLAGQALQLNGVGLRAVAWFKGYAAGLYLGQRAQTAEQVLGMQGAKRLSMRMMVDVPVGEFVKAFHKGIDFATAQGSDVIAVAAGVVTFAGEKAGYGNLVEVSHGNGLVTRYGHNQALAVGVGKTVARGDLLAYVGNTGRSTGPHVHFEVLKGGRQIDPVTFIGR